MDTTETKTTPELIVAKQAPPPPPEEPICALCFRRMLANQNRIYAPKSLQRVNGQGVIVHTLCWSLRMCVPESRAARAPVVPKSLCYLSLDKIHLFQNRICSYCTLPLTGYPPVVSYGRCTHAMHFHCVSEITDTVRRHFCPRCPSAEQQAVADWMDKDTSDAQMTYSAEQQSEEPLRSRTARSYSMTPQSVSVFVESGRTNEVLQAHISSIVLDQGYRLMLKHQRLDSAQFRSPVRQMVVHLQRNPKAGSQSLLEHMLTLGYDGPDMAKLGLTVRMFRGFMSDLHYLFDNQKNTYFPLEKLILKPMHLSMYKLFMLGMDVGQLYSCKDTINAQMLAMLRFNSAMFAACCGNYVQFVAIVGNSNLKLFGCTQEVKARWMEA